MYYEGQGVERNAREAYRWYEQALAQHEDAYTLYCVGFCLLHGQGVKRDLRGALRHLRRAATLGDVNAQFELGTAYYRGNGVTRSPRLAMKWLRQAAYHGHEEALSFLHSLEGPVALDAKGD
jgi:TPR repeat protein